MANVVTARGEALDMDNLKAKASRPLNFRERGSEVKQRRIPNKATPINVRGYQPKLGESKPDLSNMAATQKEMEESADIPFEGEYKKSSASSFSESGVAQSVADVTGLRIDEAKYTTREDVEEAGRPVEKSEEVLHDIMSELSDSHAKAVEAAEKEEAQETKATRSRKK